MVWTAFKPILMILFLTGLGLVILVLLEHLFPEYALRNWSWVLYAIGCLAVFLIFSRKFKAKSPTVSRDQSASGSVPAEHASGSSAELEELRNRIRRRKQRGAD
jgi:hypothetical protein